MIERRRYTIQCDGSREAVPCPLVDILIHTDAEHAEPLRALAIGATHEIEQVAAPSWIVRRVA